jgi:hypothetical protein
MRLRPAAPTALAIAALLVLAACARRPAPPDLIVRPPPSRPNAVHLQCPVRCEPYGRVVNCQVECPPADALRPAGR